MKIDFDEPSEKRDGLMRLRDFFLDSDARERGVIAKSHVQFIGSMFGLTVPRIPTTNDQSPLRPSSASEFEEDVMTVTPLPNASVPMY
jgi:hypothetical protein